MGTDTEQRRRGCWQNSPWWSWPFSVHSPRQGFGVPQWSGDDRGEKPPSRRHGHCGSECCPRLGKQCQFRLQDRSQHGDGMLWWRGFGQHDAGGARLCDPSVRDNPSKSTSKSFSLSYLLWHGGMYVSFFGSSFGGILLGEKEAEEH